jgi:hypothetical protein
MLFVPGAERFVTGIIFTPGSRKTKNARLLFGTKYLQSGLWRRDLADAAAGDG